MEEIGACLLFVVAFVATFYAIYSLPRGHCDCERQPEPLWKWEEKTTKKEPKA